MIEVTLQRQAYLDSGTFGRLTMPDGSVVYTVERPWVLNHRSVSCIPEGSYVCRPAMFHRGGYEAIEVCDVPDRSRILIHRANWPEQVEGCIGVGERLTCLDGRLGVTRSRHTFERVMMPQLGHVEWMLHIRRPIEARTWEQKDKERNQ